MSQLELPGSTGELLTFPPLGAELCVVVYGVPQPAGSKSSFAIKAGPKGNQHYTGKVGMADGRTEASRERHKSWRAAVQEAAEQALAESAMVPETINGPCVLTATFTLDRPKAHFLVDGSLSAAGRRMPYPTGKPDGTKLLRSVEDSLKDAGVYRDDSLIVRSVWAKDWSRRVGVGDILSRPGCVIRVRALA